MDVKRYLEELKCMKMHGGETKSANLSKELKFSAEMNVVY